MAQDLAKDSECVSLVGQAPVHRPYTEEGGCSQDYQDMEMDYVDTNVSILSQFHEDAIFQAGIGRFQWILFFITGLGLAADSIEILIVAYVMPSAERNLCMDYSQKEWLSCVSFVGMIIGGVLWGHLADKIGRRRILISALTTNAFFAIVTAFMPNYGFFVVFRLCSGIGIGGSLPIVFTYYGEFLPKNNRGQHLSWLLIFWILGGVIVSVTAWAVIPRTGLTILLSENVHFSSWRLFLVICVTPSVFSVIGLMFLPESPRFLLEVGRNAEAMCVYQEVFKSNHAPKSGMEYQLTELELPTRRPTDISHTVTKDILTDLFETLDSFWRSFGQVLWPPYSKITMILLVVWVTTSFGFYGISAWSPEYIKKLHVEEHQSNTVDVHNQTIENVEFNATLENINFYGSHFDNVRFNGMVLSHCIFENCVFLNSTFVEVRSSKTFFRHSEFYNIFFIDTDFQDYRFQECNFQDSTFVNTKQGCTIDYDINFNLRTIFLENLFVQLASVPGIFISSCVVNRLGRVKTLGTSLLLASLTAFFTWILESEASVIVFQSVVCFISISGWNAIDIITTEIYPTHIRTTGYGFLSSVSWFAAILGKLTFGTFINASKVGTILTTATVFLIGGIVSLRLPETRDTFM
ncbi:synaptic vesicle glycoprotein 2C-like [Tachypleus tridentatus]|uniref:synaptic vesicle glycoprotein 2C-like n=1 Tax=Tachypleus tridentatus TaxID=6853 RepID=UPI003FD35C7F